MVSRAYDEVLDQAARIMAKGWFRKRKIEVVQVTGPWADLDEGRCQRCDDQRRLYAPLAMPELKVCAPCTEVCAVSTIPNQYGDREDDPSNESKSKPKKKKKTRRVHVLGCDCWLCAEPPWDVSAVGADSGSQDGTGGSE